MLKLALEFLMKIFIKQGANDEHRRVGILAHRIFVFLIYYQQAQNPNLSLRDDEVGEVIQRKIKPAKF